MPAVFTKRVKAGYCLLALAIVLAVGISVLMGAGIKPGESLKTLFTPTEMSASARLILFQVRLPRLAMCLLVGMALAASGTVMQGMFRNALADPYILGVSSGAGLGAAIAFAFELQKRALGMGPVVILAFLGGLVSVSMVYLLSLRQGKMSTTALLLSGVAVSSLFGALNMLVMRLNHDKIANIIFWSMGSLSNASWRTVLWVLPFVFLGVGILWVYAKDLDLLAQGEESALLLGVNVKRTRMVLMAVTALTTSAAVAASGIIGFVGLMVPHVARMIFGPGHKHLIPLGALLGAVFLLVMDTLARTLASPLELPVGLLTSLCGVPFFLVILRKQGA